MRFSQLRKVYLLVLAFLSSVMALILILMPSVAQAATSSFIGGLNKVSTVASTVPANGDQNP